MSTGTRASKSGYSGIETWMIAGSVKNIDFSIPHQFGQGINRTPWLALVAQGNHLEPSRFNFLAYRPGIFDRAGNRLKSLSRPIL